MAELCGESTWSRPCGSSASSSHRETTRLGGKRTGGFRNLSAIAGIGVRSHRCEQLLSGLGNGSRLLQDLGAFGRKKLSDLTKFSLAPPTNWAIVSEMAKHDP